MERKPIRTKGKAPNGTTDGVGVIQSKSTLNTFQTIGDDEKRREKSNTNVRKRERERERERDKDKLKILVGIVRL